MQNTMKTPKHYSDELIDEIKQKNDIVDVISSCVKLTKKGSNYFGLCPFHDEKTGSFSVTPRKQMFYCFGCHEGGNVISFIQKYEKMTFPEAIRFLADRAGIELPEFDAGTREMRSLRSKLLEINKETATYYSEKLWAGSGCEGLDYLKERGLTDETIHGFGLGFAPDSKDDLYRHLRSKGFNDDALLESGLFVYKEKRGVTDRFWNRIIFPITDPWHKIVGFGGRIVGEGQPKYLNSPETIVFDKGGNLFGLDIAKSTRAKNLIICEGYMDAIALHQAGVDQAVATLGTAFTLAHARMIEKYSKIYAREGELARHKDVLLCFDSDNAGLDAVKRTLSKLREVDIRAKVLVVKPYKDPDEFMNNEGIEEFEKRIDSAENGFLYEVRILEDEYDMADPSGKSQFLRDVAARLIQFDDPVERENYTKLIAGIYEISTDSFAEVVKNALKKASA